MFKIGDRVVFDNKGIISEGRIEDIFTRDGESTPVYQIVYTTRTRATFIREQIISILED